MDPGWSEFFSSFNEGTFVEEVLPDMGACLNTRKEHQATWEPWEVSLHGAGGVPSLGCLCLRAFA